MVSPASQGPLGSSGMTRSALVVPDLTAEAVRMFDAAPN